MARVYRNLEEMRLMYERYESSGQTLQVFCEYEGINKHTFQYWRSKITKDSFPDKTTVSNRGFHRILPDRLSRGGTIVLRFSPGQELELPGDYPAERLVQILRGLS